MTRVSQHVHNETRVTGTGGGEQRVPARDETADPYAEGAGGGCRHGTLGLHY